MPPLSPLEIGLLGQNKGVIHLNAKIPDGAPQLRVAEQELTNAKVAGTFVSERHLGPAQAAGAVSSWIEAGEGNSLVHKSAVLPRRDMFAEIAPARKQPIAGPRAVLLQPSGNRIADRVGQLKRYRSASVLLKNDRSKSDAVAKVNVCYA